MLARSAGNGNLTGDQQRNRPGQYRLESMLIRTEDGVHYEDGGHQGGSGTTSVQSNALPPQSKLDPHHRPDQIHSDRNRARAIELPVDYSSNAVKNVQLCSFFLARAGLRCGRLLARNRDGT